MDLISKLLTLHNQLKVYHWQTDSYAQHQAFGGAYDAFTGHIDQFVEEFMGQYSRIMNKEGFILLILTLKHLTVKISQMLLILIMMVYILNLMV